jgi:hypothetical protein
MKQKSKDLLLWLTFLLNVLIFLSTFLVKPAAPTNIGVTSGNKSPVIQDNKAPVIINDTDTPKDKPGDKK